MKRVYAAVVIGSFLVTCWVSRDLDPSPSMFAMVWLTLGTVTTGLVMWVEDELLP